MDSLTAKMNHRHCRSHQHLHVTSNHIPPSSLKLMSQPSEKSSLFNQIPKTLTLIILPTTIATSALLLLRGNKDPRIIAAPIVSIEEEEQEKSIRSSIKNPNLGVEHYYLEEGSITIRLIELDSEGCDWGVLRARIRSSSEGLEKARRGFEEAAEKDPERAGEYAENVGELIGILRDMEVVIERSVKERKKLDFRFLNGLLVRARFLELKFFKALKDIQEQEEEEEQEQEQEQDQDDVKQN